MRIQIIRIQLWFVRWLRRILRGIGYCKYSLILIPFWLIYVTVVYFWGIHIGKIATFTDVIWESKSGFFTSVVLAALTSFISHYNQYRYTYIERHNTYLALMSAMSNVYIKTIEVISGNISRSLIPYFPFYYDNMPQKACEDFTKIHKIDYASQAYNECFVNIRNLEEKLKKFQEKTKDGTFPDCNSYKMKQSIEECTSDIRTISELLESGASFNTWQYRLEHFVESGLEILDIIRIPWRIDLKRKKKILKLIYREDKSVADTFYNSAFLNVIDYAQYAMFAKALTCKSGKQALNMIDKYYCRENEIDKETANV